MATHKDSFDKIVTAYFAVVTKEPFEYKGKRYDPKDIQVSPAIFRGFSCPSNCGGCCSRFTLDYLPDIDPAPSDSVLRSFDTELVPREVHFNGSRFTLRSNVQADHTDHHCRFLNKRDGQVQQHRPDVELGRCLVHGSQPFTCDFELLRFSITASPSRPNYINQRLYGRGWQLLRHDNETRGALCEMTPVTPEWVADIARRLKRLKDWTDYFELDTHLPQIIAWVERGPHNQPLLILQKAR